MATQTPGEKVRVAVLGTGIMGSAMARNLLTAGLRTTVWDRSPAATAPLSDAGALVAASPAEAVRDAQVVITMLPTADVVTSVIFDSGVADALPAGAVWAQMGTIGLAETTGISSRLGELRPDVMFVDAPVSGSKGPAEAAAAHPGLRPARSGSGRGAGVLSDRPQDRLAGRGRPGQPDEAGRQRLHVHPDRGRGRGPGTGGSWASTIRSWPRPSRADRWTHRSRTPSCTKWSEATSRPSSRWNGHSRTWTWRSVPQVATSCRCWPRYRASGTLPLTPDTAGKTSAPPASPSAPTSSPDLPAHSGRTTQRLSGCHLGNVTSAWARSRTCASVTCRTLPRHRGRTVADMRDTSARSAPAGCPHGRGRRGSWPGAYSPVCS